MITHNHVTKTTYAIMLFLVMIFPRFANGQEIAQNNIGKITKSFRVIDPTTGNDQPLHYSFYITWKSKLAPEAIYYKENNNWWYCTVSKNSKNIYPEKIEKRDRLIVNTIRSAPHSMPDDIKHISTPSLFFHIRNEWISLPVEDMKDSPVRYSGHSWGR